MNQPPQPPQQSQQSQHRRWRRNHIRALIDIRRDTNSVNIMCICIYSFFTKILSSYIFLLSGIGACCPTKQDDIGTT